MFKKFMVFGFVFFVIGYIIGIGSVILMIVVGSIYGMLLFWVFFLSCLFLGVFIYVYGNYVIVIGEIVFYVFRKYLKFGKLIVIFIIVGVIFG